MRHLAASAHDCGQGWRCLRLPGELGMRLRSLHGLRAVSYTHLDVYKRQRYNIYVWSYRERRANLLYFNRRNEQESLELGDYIRSIHLNCRLCSLPLSHLCQRRGTAVPVRCHNLSLIHIFESPSLRRTKVET